MVKESNKVAQKKFVKQEEEQIHINTLAEELKVERRRIYDIVNILEGLDIVQKKQKNIYIWKDANNFLNKLKFISNNRINNLKCNQKIFCFESCNYSLRKKFLTYLSIDFLKRFYQENHFFSFKNILQQYQTQDENNNQEKQKKTNQRRLRRVYDVINVFKALGLIEKSSQIIDQKKFVWREPKFFRKIKLRKLKNQKLDKENINYKLPNSGFKVCKYFKNFNVNELKRVMHVKDINTFNQQQFFNLFLIMNQFLRLNTQNQVFLINFCKYQFIQRIFQDVSQLQAIKNYLNQMCQLIINIKLIFFNK